MIEEICRILEEDEEFQSEVEIYRKEYGRTFDQLVEGIMKRL